MNKRWYIAILVLTLAVVGFHQPVTKIHNQEIVLQFNTANTSSVQINSAIQRIKSQLATAGVFDFDVDSESSGQLKIKYYSQQTIESIKELLSENGSLVINTSQKNSGEIPIKNSEKDYNLDIYEIHHANDTNKGVNGILTKETNSELQRLSTQPKVLTNAVSEYNSPKNELGHKIQVYIFEGVVLTDYRNFKIPIVRAGPIV